MSRKGIEKFASIMSAMQEARLELLGGNDTQDILLGQLLEKAKETVKHRFCEITMDPGKSVKAPMKHAILGTVQCHEITSDEWNSRYPIGTRVRYYPVTGVPDHKDTQTRSIAWNLGGGHPVVQVDGMVGGVSLKHLEILKDDIP